MSKGLVRSSCSISRTNQTAGFCLHFRLRPGTWTGHFQNDPKLPEPNIFDLFFGATDLLLSVGRATLIPLGPVQGGRLKGPPLLVSRQTWGTFIPIGLVGDTTTNTTLWCSNMCNIQTAHKPHAITNTAKSNSTKCITFETNISRPELI